ncbi:MAG: hypothetical protein Tsb0020_30870 [Haliangiales bacterium]
MSKVWFITGASSGIGAGVVKAALAAGQRVVATARDIDKLTAAIGAPRPDQLISVRLDVTSEEQSQAAVEHAIAAFGRIDVLVNNAGYCALGNLESLTTAQLRDQFETNFWGLLNVTRAALPILRSQRAGHIFCISSVGGVIGFGGGSAYVASKFAVEGLSLSLAQELESFGVKVTVVEPGFFRTDLLGPQSLHFGHLEVDGYDSPKVVRRGLDPTRDRAALELRRRQLVGQRRHQLAQPGQVDVEADPQQRLLRRRVRLTLERPPARCRSGPDSPGVRSTRRVLVAAV